MLIRAGYTIEYTSPQPSPLMLMLNVHPSREPDLETPDRIVLDPPIPSSSYLDSFGNRCARIVAPAGLLRISSDFVIRDSGLPDDVAPQAKQHDIQDLPDETLIYLLGSRYCETDRLSNEAWQAFGHLPKGWGLVQAIVDAAHERIAFGYHNARNTRTALEGWTERVGVCRDFAHMAVTLCRCMNIPARYCTGYLGDIGVPAVPDPMDFSAWFEVWLGDRWYTFDARHNQPRIGRVVMARGRDAADVAMVTSFGATMMSRFEVVTDEVIEQQAPATRISEIMEPMRMRA